MNLIIDVGNSFIKLAVFDNDVLLYKKTCLKPDFLHILTEVGKLYPNIEHCMMSSVGNLTEHQLSKLNQSHPVSLLSHNSTVPFANKYSTPQTLGVDRMALVSAAAIHYPGKNVLVVDVGTCITYDFINFENEYLGGAISPGLIIRYKSLNTFTNKLPLLDISETQAMTGNSTATSIHSGVINGATFEIDGFVEAYKAKYDDLTVILTGGDAHFLRDRLKNDIFANSNFLLEGLNYILEHNKHNY